MSVNIVNMKCPSCGADIEVNGLREYSFCSYCGSKISLVNDNEHIYRNIDEARIKEAEVNHAIRLKELELEEKDSSTGRKSTYVAYGIALALGIVGALLCFVNIMVGMIFVCAAMYIGLFANSSSTSKKKKIRVANENEVKITESMECYSDKNYQTIELLFRSAGFTNVTCISLNDLNVFNQKRNGKVETVTINGSEDFEEDEIYPKSANILITYHSRG